MEQRRKELLEEADWLFRKMVRRFVKERDKVAIEGISLPSFLILQTLRKEGVQRAGALGDLLDLTSGAVTALCDKLEQGGYAVRKRTEEDRRTVYLEITEKGRQLLDRHRNIGPETIDLLFGPFTDEELQEQIRLYQRILDHLEHFSSSLLERAEENAEPDGGGLHDPLPPNKFISY